MTLSQLWKLHLLESICVNIQKEETHLNPSVTVLHNTEMGKKLSQDFLQPKKWTDVSFEVEGTCNEQSVYWQRFGKMHNQLCTCGHYLLGVINRVNRNKYYNLRSTSITSCVQFLHSCKLWMLSYGSWACGCVVTSFCYQLIAIAWIYPNVQLP